MKPTHARIKICGLRETETIEAMNGLPFHEIGFVFAPSKRQVSREEASRLIETAGRIKAAEGKPPVTVGVFVNMPLNEMDGLLSDIPLQVVQLHGSETPDYCLQVKRRHPEVSIWRVFSVVKEANETAGKNTIEDASSRLDQYRGLIDAVLIDAPGGGTGEPFDWQAIESYKSAAAQLGLPLYVAGGLNEGNVRELLAGYAPDGVDVSSGVETDGRKDINKIRLFVGKVTTS